MIYANNISLQSVTKKRISSAISFFLLSASNRFPEKFAFQMPTIHLSEMKSYKFNVPMTVGAPQFCLRYTDSPLRFGLSDFRVESTRR